MTIHIYGDIKTDGFCIVKSLLKTQETRCIEREIYKLINGYPVQHIHLNNLHINSPHRSGDTIHITKELVMDPRIKSLLKSLISNQDFSIIDFELSVNPELKPLTRNICDEDWDRVSNGNHWEVRNRDDGEVILYDFNIFPELYESGKTVPVYLMKDSHIKKSGESNMLALQVQPGDILVTDMRLVWGYNVDEIREVIRSQNADKHRPSQTVSHISISSIVNNLNSLKCVKLG